MPRKLIVFMLTPNTQSSIIMRLLAQNFSVSSGFVDERHGILFTADTSKTSKEYIGSSFCVNIKSVDKKSNGEIKEIVENILLDILHFGAVLIHTNASAVDVIIGNIKKESKNVK